MNRLEALQQLRQIAGMRERRAAIECQARQRRQVEAQQALDQAVLVAQQLHEARDEVLSAVWRHATVTGQAVQAAMHCADHLAQRHKAAKQLTRQAEAAEAEAAARWAEGRKAQAHAQRACLKLDHAQELQAAGVRRAAESRLAQRHDDGLQTVPEGLAW